MASRYAFFAVAATVLAAPLLEVHEDFNRDPGWEAVNNRIVCQDCPTVT